MEGINIKTDREYLREILGKIDKGQFAIPVFQRDFVWQKKQVIDLFDSLSKGYPIGSVILWKPETKMSRTKDVLTDQIIEPSDPEYYILDGRQRLTTFYGCIKNDEDKDDIFKLSYDLEDMSFVYAKSNTLTVLRVSDIYDTFLMLSKLQQLMSSALDEVKKKIFVERARQMNALLQSYTIGEIMMNNCSLEDASTAFARINSKGTTISPLYMLQALTYSKDGGMLIDKEIETIISALTPYGFDSLYTQHILNCFYQYVGLNSYDNKLEDLAKSDFPNYIADIRRDLEKSVKFLFEQCYVISSKLLPYGRQLELICSFFRLNPQPSEHDLTELRRWFFYTSYNQSFMNGSLSVVRSLFRRFALFAKHQADTAYDYEPISVSGILDSRFNLSSAKVDFIMLVEIHHYLALCPIGEPVYTKYRKLLPEQMLQYVVMFVSPTDSRDLVSAIESRDEAALAKYSLTPQMLSKLYDDEDSQAFVQMRTEYLVRLQLEFLCSLDFEVL